MATARQLFRTRVSGRPGHVFTSQLFVKPDDFLGVLELAVDGARSETEITVHFIAALKVNEVPGGIAGATAGWRLSEAKLATFARALEHHDEHVLAGAAEVERVDVFEIRSPLRQRDVEALVKR